MILLLKNIVMEQIKTIIYLPTDLCDYLINTYETNSENLERTNKKS